MTSFPTVNYNVRAFALFSHRSCPPGFLNARIRCRVIRAISFSLISGRIKSRSRLYDRPVIYSEKLSSMALSPWPCIGDRLKRRQNDSSISDNCSIDPSLLPSSPDTLFRRGHLVGFSAFFGDGKKYRARYCVRRELRLVNRPILFNRLYRVNNRAHLPSLFFSFIAARFTASNR